MERREMGWRALVVAFHRYDDAAGAELLRRMMAPARQISRVKLPGSGRWIPVDSELLAALESALAAELFLAEMSFRDGEGFGMPRQHFILWGLLGALGEDPARDRRRLARWVESRLVRAAAALARQGEAAPAGEVAALAPAMDEIFEEGGSLVTPPLQYWSGGVTAGEASRRWAGTARGGLPAGLHQDPRAFVPGGEAPLPAGRGEDPLLDAAVALLFLFNGGGDGWRVERLHRLWAGLAPGAEVAALPRDQRPRAWLAALLEDVGAPAGRASVKPGELRSLALARREAPEVAARLEALRGQLALLQEEIDDDPLRREEAADLRLPLQGLVCLSRAGVDPERWGRVRLARPKPRGGSHDLRRDEAGVPCVPLAPRVAAWMAWHAVELGAERRRDVRPVVGQLLRDWGFSASIENSLGPYLLQVNPLIDLASAALGPGASGASDERPR
jgi:hypothetical protein